MIWDHARAAVGVDLVLLSVHQGRLDVLVQAREKEPERSSLALPGGLFRPPSLTQWKSWRTGERAQGWDPSLKHAAQRILRERTGLAESTWMEQLYTFGAMERDSRGPVLSVAWWVPLSPQTREIDGQWMPLKDLPGLAFDHAQIATMALERLRGKLDYAPHLAAHFLSPTFSTSELREVFESVHGVAPNRGSFARRLEKWDWLESVGERGTLGRPARLFRVKQPVPDPAPK
ncbi:MAG: 8-oxo-dGTP diphosphatase [Cognaticolwellia sp.]|jgi:8-oxo-dGTP diphosphatase